MKTNPLPQYPESVCSCNGCRAACLTSPCFPTPDEAGELIDKGYGDKLGLSFFPDSVKGCLQVLISPKPDGYEKILSSRDGQRMLTSIGVTPDIIMQMIVEDKLNICTFLSVDGMCELHAAGLKPLEGRIEGCHIKHTDSFNLRSSVCELWRCEKGNQVLNEFSKEHTGMQQFVNKLNLDYVSIEEGIQTLHSI